jgi:hypothetical protein
LLSSAGFKRHGNQNKNIHFWVAQHMWETVEIWRVSWRNLNFQKPLELWMNESIEFFLLKIVISDKKKNPRKFLIFDTNDLLY